MQEPGQTGRRRATAVTIWLWKALGIVLLVPTLFAFGLMRDNKNPVLMRLEAALGAGALGVLCTICYQRGKKLAAPRGEEVLAKDERPPVLYLRSFNDDEVTGRSPQLAGVPFQSFTTEEELLARGFKAIGPLVAIGIPSDELPKLGAARIKVHDSEWRDRVLELMEQARLVVLRVGDTEGLRWELGMANWKLTPERLLLLVPGSRESYQRFREHANLRMRKPLPEYPSKVKYLEHASVVALIRFEQDWNPEFIVLRKPGWRSTKRLDGALESALEAVRRDLAV